MTQQVRTSWMDTAKCNKKSYSDVLFKTEIKSNIIKPVRIFYTYCWLTNALISADAHHISLFYTAFHFLTGAVEYFWCHNYKSLQRHYQEKEN